MGGGDGKTGGIKSRARDLGDVLNGAFCTRVMRDQVRMKITRLDLG